MKYSHATEIVFLCMITGLISPFVRVNMKPTVFVPKGSMRELRFCYKQALDFDVWWNILEPDKLHPREHKQNQFYSFWMLEYINWGFIEEIFQYWCLLDYSGAPSKGAWTKSV